LAIARSSLRPESKRPLEHDIQMIMRFFQTGSLKAALKMLMPPILWQAAHRIRSRMARKSPPVFEGPFASWADAVSASNSEGWDSPSVLNKTLDAALKVRDGLAEFQQDSVVMTDIIYSPTILAFLCLILSRYDSVNVLDFGGQLGTNYFQNRRILRSLGSIPTIWNIVETEAFARLGKQHLQSDELRFFPSIREAPILNAVLFSGSLQYVSNPFEILEFIINAGATIIALDRVALHSDPDHTIFVQHAPGIYGASFAVWQFSRDALVGWFEGRGLRLVDQLVTPYGHVDNSGMIFVR